MRMRKVEEKLVPERYYVRKIEPPLRALKMKEEATSQGM